MRDEPEISVEQTVYACISDKIAGREIQLKDTTPIGADGLGFDSIDFLDLLLDIESRSGWRLRDEALTEDAFATVGGLITYVKDVQRG